MKTQITEEGVRPFFVVVLGFAIAVTVILHLDQQNPVGPHHGSSGPSPQRRKRRPRW